MCPVHFSRPTLEAQLAHAHMTGDAAVEAALLNQLGDIAREELEYDLAQGLYGQAWAAYERAGDARGAAMARVQVADVMVITRPEQHGERYDAILLSLLDDAMTQFEALNDLSGQAAVWRVRGNYENRPGSLMIAGFPVRSRTNEMAREYYGRAQHLYEQANDLEGEIEVFFAERANNPVWTSFNEAKYQTYFEETGDYENLVWILCAQALSAREPSNDAMPRDRNEQTYLYLEQASALYRQWGDTFKNFPLLDWLGDYLYEIEDYSTAYQVMKHALTWWDHDPEKIFVEGTLSVLTRTAQKLEDYAAAEDYIEFHLGNIERRDRPHDSYLRTRAHLLMHLGEIKALRGNIMEGRRDYHAALLTIDQLPTAEIQNQLIPFLYRWGKIEYDASYSQVGHHLCNEAVNRATQARFHRIQIWRWAKEIEAMTNDLSENQILHRPTLESNLATARETGDLTTQANCLLVLGTFALDEKEYGLAQGLYAQALDLYQLTNNQKGMADALVASGNMLVYGTPADMRTAVDFFQQALTLYQALDDQMAQAHLFVRLGFLLWNMGENETRLPLYREALVLFEQIKDPAILSPLALELAGSMYGHPDFAVLYERALKIHQQAEYERGQTSSEGSSTPS